MRFMASVSYDGSKFYGFQKLKDKPTVQAELEKVLSKLNKSPVRAIGAGRTDRGTHAYNQMIHFDIDFKVSPEGLKAGINAKLNNSIHINYCKEVTEDFHARFCVKEKTYEYKINTGTYDPLTKDYIYNYCKKLNIKKMKKASKYLLGYHSYKAYVCGKRDNYDTAIYNIKIIQKKDIMFLTFVGKNFYQYMVRNLVGALLLVGEEKIKPECLYEMLISGENIYNYATAPACGLYLMNIKY